ncbi:MAG: hypothetical protein LBC77_05965 [Spirochaetaceae bacterium]|jgi:hypothetical protein|nr:hypothetical protein [Spirochaetaceae bacterium]
MTKNSKMRVCFPAFSAFLAIALVFTACDQFPIFFTISHEVAPKKAKIPGSPSKIVAGVDTLYVCNGDVWKAVSGSSWRWSSLSKPSSGPVRDLAHTTSALYALTLGSKDHTSTIWKYTSSWTKVASAGNMRYQAIFNAGSDLVASAWSGSASENGRDYSIVKIADDGTETVLKPGVNQLTGIANGFYATLGSGIFDSSFNQIAGTENKAIVGITEYEIGGFAAVSKDGYFFWGSGSSAQLKSYSPLSFTGAICNWTDLSNNKLLLIGVRLNSTQFGYHEMRVPDGIGGALYYPGEGSPTSVSDRETYTTTIETRALNSIKQAGAPSQDGLPLLFASTQSDGLWSFRRDGGSRPVWNRED